MVWGGLPNLNEEFIKSGQLENFQNVLSVKKL